MGLFGKKSFDKLDEKNLIQVKGIKDVRKSLKQLGETEKSSRSLINKALRPAAKKQ